MVREEEDNVNETVPPKDAMVGRPRKAGDVGATDAPAHTTIDHHRRMVKRKQDLTNELWSWADFRRGYS